MHYYKFNIGDYRRDTIHLSIVEHYIYRSLIDWYYLDELPIPLETGPVMRRLGLSKEMENDLLNILSDFFKKTSKGWVNKRADKDIAIYHRNANKNKENGMLGGRPKKPK